jgi:hypothetical protein
VNVLVACEESQEVCKAFRDMGHRAFSCDIQECSGGHPEWHVQGDVLPLLNGDCFFTTADTHTHTQRGPWDLIIAHPPCTYLTMVATKYHSLKCTPLDKINARTMLRIEAMDFFMKFVNANCEKIAIENPRGVMNTVYRQPDQTIDPYMFAESTQDTENYVTKATCLWLKGLPPLVGYGLPKPDNAALYGRYANGKARCWEEMQSGPDRSKTRSKTFPGVAKAMSEQWGGGMVRSTDALPGQIQMEFDNADCRQDSASGSA